MKGLPLILLHGYPFDSSMWKLTRKHLAWKGKVIAPNLWPTPSPEPSLEMVADDLAPLVPGPAVIAGFSMGGYVALALADRHPHLVAAIALINSQSAADTDEVRQGRRTMVEKVKKEGIRPATDAALPKLFAKQDPALTRYPLKGAERAGAEGITWALEAMARRPDRTPVLQRLGQPILIVHSAEDKFIPVTRARDLASVLKAKYVEIDGAGHCTPLEAPEKVAAALSEFADGR
jgi:pimeloyl-ACP methyl ester carboxylesterase